MAVKSASNVAERRPVSRKGKASVKGAAGITGEVFGEMMVKDIEERAEQEVKAQTSLKDRLRTLMTLDAKGHESFRSTLQKRVDQINDAAKAASQSVAEYRAHNAVANSIYTMLSVWKNLSLACAAGYEPDIENLPWSTICSNATAYKNSTGKPAPELVKERERINADKDMAPQAKAQALVELDKKIEQSAKENAKHPDSTTRVGRPETPLIQKLETLLKGRPLHELEEAYKWLGNYIKTQAKGNERILATPSGRGTGVPKATSEKPNNHKDEEPALMKGNKRTSRKTSKK